MAGRSRWQPSKSISGNTASGPRLQEGHIPTGQTGFYTQLKVTLKSLYPANSKPHDLAGLKNFLFCSEGVATTPGKTHSFYWLNRPNGSQHSTKECPLLCTQINRYTHWQRPKDTSVLVLIWYCWWSPIPYCSNLKPRGNGKGSKCKKKSQYLLWHQFHSPLLIYMNAAFVWRRRRYPSEWTAATGECKAWQVNSAQLQGSSLL